MKETSNSLLEAIQREINVLRSFRHANIICLIGYCLPPVQELRASGQRMKELCLVHELAPLGGLNGLLKDDDKASMMLWQYRLKTNIGVAKGLCCMHNNIPGRPAYHRDMKAANIAVMADYTAKIIDCGLSKYVPETSLEGLSMRSSGSKDICVQCTLPGICLMIVVAKSFHLGSLLAVCKDAQMGIEVGSIWRTSLTMRIIQF